MNSALNENGAPRRSVLLRQVLQGLILTAVAMSWADGAWASHLEVAPQAPEWMHLAAGALLAVHIGGGGIGIVSGAAALLLRKGGPAHRAVGKIFFVVMLIAYTVATCVAPFLNDGQRTNFVAGVVALYLLLSGWRAATHRDLRAGPLEIAGLAIALLITGAGVVLMRMGANNPTGTVDGSPAQAFIAFALVGAVAAVGELNVILRRTIAGAARISRHLWRMCFSLFIASGSFFLGQQRFMPGWIRGSPILLVCALAPLAAMIFWLIWVRFAGRFKNSITSERAAT